MLVRESYLSKIRGFYDSDLIKILVGIRRCGKSVILNQIIDEYYVKDNIEYIQFDFAAQNTGNIFKYKHNLDTDEYFMESQLVFTYLGIEELPIEIVKSAFEVARDNKENIKLLKKIRNINSH